MKRVWLMVAALGAALIPAAAAFAEPLPVEIAGSGDDVPTSPTNVHAGLLFGPPAMSQGGLSAVFGHGFDTNSQSGALVLWSVDMPGYVGVTENLNFTQYDPVKGGEVSPMQGEFSTEEKDVATRWAKTISGQPVLQVVTVLGGDASNVVTLMQEGDVRPGEIGTVEGFGPPSMAGTQVLFVVSGTEGRGLYLSPKDAASPTLVLKDGQDPLQIGEGISLQASNLALARDGTAAFVARYNGGLGIHLRGPDGSIQTVVRGDEVPGYPNLLFQSIRGLYMDKGHPGDLVFWFRAGDLFDPESTVEGIGARIGGEVFVASDNNTPSEFGPLFVRHGDRPSVSAGRIFYHTGYGPPHPETNALYMQDGCTGEVTRVLAQGDQLGDHRVVEEVQIASEAASGFTLGALVKFYNDHPNDLRFADQGVYSLYIASEQDLAVALGGVTATTEDFDNNDDGTFSTEMEVEYETCDGTDKVKADVTTQYPALVEGLWTVLVHETVMPDSVLSPGVVVLNAVGTTVKITSVDRASSPDTREGSLRDLQALTRALDVTAESAKMYSGVTGTSDSSAVYSTVAAAAYIGTVRPLIIKSTQIKRASVYVNVVDASGVDLDGVLVSLWKCADDTTTNPDGCVLLDSNTTEDGFVDVYFLGAEGDQGVPPWLVTATDGVNSDAVIVTE